MEFLLDEYFIDEEKDDIYIFSDELCSSCILK